MVNATHRDPCGGRAVQSLIGLGRRQGLRLMVAVVLALSVVKLPLGSQAFAQAKKKDADAASAKVDTGAIQRAYAGGTRSFEAGDMAGAEQQLSVALAGGGLPNSQMARALYLRGAAARRLGKPAQAISDLTTAVWLKGGLSDTDKAKATEERQLAYREAGLGDTPPPIGAAPLDQGAGTAAAPTPKTGAQVVQVTQQSFWNNFSLPTMPTLPSFGSLTGSSSQPAAVAPAAALSAEAAPAQVAAAPEAGSSSSGTSFFNFQSSQPAQTETASTQPSSSWDTQTASHTATIEVPAAPQPISTGYAPTHAPDAGLNPLSATANPAAPQGTISNPLAGSGTAVSNFFGNMFGTGPSAAQEPAAPATAEHVQNWGPESTVVTAQTSSMVQRGPDSPPPSSTAQDDLPWSASGGGAPAAAPVKVAATGGAGKYKLQVAAVRSRAEAEKLAQSLHGFQPVRDGVVAAEIDEAVIGSMGTFYRVRLGPYADAKEPGQLCKTLKPQGFDCLVVTQ
jgi:hypothetical protein